MYELGLLEPISGLVDITKSVRVVDLETYMYKVRRKGLCEQRIGLLLRSVEIDGTKHPVAARVSLTVADC